MRRAVRKIASRWGSATDSKSSSPVSGRATDGCGRGVSYVMGCLRFGSHLSPGAILELLVQQQGYVCEADGTLHQAPQEREARAIHERHVGDIEREPAPVQQVPLARALELAHPGSNHPALEPEDGVLRRFRDLRDSQHRLSLQLLPMTGYRQGQCR